MITCAKVRALLSGYVDRELSPDEMSEIRHHLFECSHCSSEHQSLAKAKESVLSMASAEPSDDFLKLLACKPWELSPSEQTHRTKILPWYKKRWVMAGIAACIPFVIAVMFIEGLGINRASSFNNTSLANSFKAEHQRYDASSPYSKYTKEPGILAGTDAESEAMLGSSEGNNEEPFIVSVSRRIVE